MEPLVFLFIFFGVGTGITYYNYVHHKELLAGVVPWLKDPQILGFMAPRLVGKYRDYSLSVTLQPGGKNSPSTLTVCLYAATPFQLHIYREGTLQKVGKKLGLVDEIEIGVPAFDDQFVIQATSASPVRTYLWDIAIRNKIEYFFNSGYHDFKIAEGALLLEKRSDDIPGDLDPMTMKAVFESLASMARQL